MSEGEGKAPWEASDVSQSTKEKVDKEVTGIITAAYDQAVVILKKNKKQLDKVAEVLLDRENLDREEFEEIVGKKK